MWRRRTKTSLERPPIVPRRSWQKSSLAYLARHESQFLAGTVSFFRAFLSGKTDWRTCRGYLHLVQYRGHAIKPEDSTSTDDKIRIIERRLESLESKVDAMKTDLTKALDRILSAVVALNVDNGPAGSQPASNGTAALQAPCEPAGPSVCVFLDCPRSRICVVPS